MSHFDAIGLRCESRGHFGEVAAELARTATALDPDPETGRTLLWSDGLARLWFHPDADWCIVPGFDARRSVHAVPTGWRDSPDGCPYCAMLDIEVLDASGGSLFPLCVTFGNIRDARRRLTLGESTSLGLTLFVERAQAIDIAPEPPANADAAGRAAAIASLLWRGGVFPLGPFSTTEPVSDVPRARVHGTLVRRDTITNGHTGHAYIRLEVESHGGIYEAVADPAIDGLAGARPGQGIGLVGWLCASLHASGSR